MISDLVAQLANDKYRATTRATYIASPADSAIQVDAIPANLPTYLVLGWNTQYETLFKVTSVSGSNSSNYALTGLTKVKGSTGNIPEGVAVNCLNNEEFFNQYATAINGLIDDINGLNFPSSNVVGITDTQTLTNKRLTPRIGTTTSSATPTPAGDSQDQFNVTALASNATFAAPTGTPTDGQILVIRIKDAGASKTLAWNAIYRAGTDVPLPSATVISKTMYLLFAYNAADTKWDLLDYVDNI